MRDRHSNSSYINVLFNLIFHYSKAAIQTKPHNNYIRHKISKCWLNLFSSHIFPIIHCNYDCPIKIWFKKRNGFSDGSNRGFGLLRFGTVQYYMYSVLHTICLTKFIKLVVTASLQAIFHIFIVKIYLIL